MCRVSDVVMGYSLCWGLHIFADPKAGNLAPVDEIDLDLEVDRGSEIAEVLQPGRSNTIAAVIV